jgi:uncharacterized protein
MRIVIDGSALLLKANGEAWSGSAEPSLQGALGREISEEEASFYLDDDLADLGVVGGKTRFALTEQNEPRVQTVFWAPRPLSRDEEQKLLADTIAQWEDGIGANGFQLMVGGQNMLVVPRQGASVSIRQEEDRRTVPEPSQVAIASRLGDFKRLRRALEAGEEIDRTHRGYTGLHLAILYGREREASYLVQRGADTNRPDKDGNTPLHLCAASNSMNDEQSSQIIRMLLKHGADKGQRAPDGLTALDIAMARGKAATAKLLREVNPI